jgi:four helix bundle protein
MSEASEALKGRALRFAVDACTLLKRLPEEEPGRTVKCQLARAATGVAFNHRNSCRARSHAEFTARIAIVADEADEALGWLEFVRDAGLSASPELTRLLTEADELAAVFSASLGTARRRERAGHTRTLKRHDRR